MTNRAKIYHFTKKENLEAIFRDGLRPGTKYATLGSKLREGANYFWLTPDNDLMGYLGDENYICLEIEIDAGFCKVANMDISSASFVNFIAAKNGEALCDYAELSRMYDSTAVDYASYKSGHFRSPEVIVQTIIPPNDIKTVQYIDLSNAYSNNLQLYNAHLSQKFARLNAEKIRLVARHDDSTGILESYLTNDTNEFFTIQLNKGG
ncbi:MAG: hypothetical protein FWB91_09755 [Defluviitaleaceae bacterium]|nr:hypothetical protein [Defluviitaleaceae bacterium]